MPEYDFKTLSPYDFEILCRDLLQKEFGVSLESFKTGRDSGIDLRYAPDKPRTLIVQCKHFASSPFSKLRAHLAKSELPKVKSLNPPRYVLATSLGLSPQQKDVLHKLFSPYCRSTQDVYGQQDLNNLLGKYPDIEKAHFKLWLTSTPVLERVLHNAIFMQSSFDREDIHRRLKLYVQTEAVGKAREILEKERCCIISGIPGIGKTTLAQILLVRYLMHDWDVITIRQNVTEGLDVFNPDPASKQVFWYDDFLGQVSFGDKLAKNEDVALLQLIKSVAKHKNKRFILTTREYILHQAQQHHEVLSRSNVEVWKYTLTLDEYTFQQKAQILLNHLYFFGVPSSHLDTLLAKRTYRVIVNHKNYSPRIVEWMTEFQRVKGIPPIKYAGLFLKILNDPTSLWEHAYSNQICKVSQLLLLTLASCGQEVQIDDLRTAFSAFLNHYARIYYFQASPTDFRDALQELEGTFVRVFKYKDGTTIGFHNPSVADFLAGRILEYGQVVKDLLCSLVYFEQLEKLINISTKGAWETSALQSILPLSDALAEAYIRTFDSPSITIYLPNLLPYGHRLSKLIRNSAARIRFGIKLAGPFAQRVLRRFVIDKIDTYMGELSTTTPGREEVIGLLIAVAGKRWIPKSKILLWQKAGGIYLLAGPMYWEEIDPVFEWLDRHDKFDDVLEVDGYLEKVKDFVREEVRETVKSESDMEVLEQKVADLDRWKSRLRRDFTSEISKLEERKLKIESDFDYEPVDEELDDYPPSEGAFDIDSMFDSLRDQR